MRIAATDLSRITRFNLRVLFLATLILFSGIATADAATPITLDSSTGTGYYPSTAIGTDGYPVIAYNDQAGSADLYFLHCTSADCSSIDAPLVLDSSPDVGLFPSVDIGADGFPVIAYYDDGAADLRLVHCTSANCTTADAPIILDAGVVGFDRISLAIGNDGFPVVNYTESNDLELIHCTSADCSTADAPVTLHSGLGGMHFANTVEIGSDGFPVVAYENGSQDLQLVHCTSASCSSFDAAITLDATAPFGANANVSVAIGADGYPVMSYGDWFNPLKFIHCTSVDCSTASAPVTLDAVDGGFSSLTIGSDGNPVMSYHDGSDAVEDLKLIHCTTPDCSTTVKFVLDSIRTTWSSIANGSDGFPVISYRDSIPQDLKFVRVTEHLPEPGGGALQITGRGMVPVFFGIIALVVGIWAVRRLRRVD